MSVSENVENVAEKFDNEDQSHHPETESESESSNDEEEEESSDDLDSGEEESEYEFAKVASKEVLQLFEMLSNDRFTDVNLVISDTVEIKSHRCVLGHFSKIFANIFENSNETPVRIYVKDFKMETLKAALEFLYGNSNAIKGKEKDVLKFANKYEILQLKKACLPPMQQPETALSAYFLWLRENRESIKKPGMSATQVSLAAGKAWQNLPDKSKWKKMATFDTKMRVLS